MDIREPEPVQTGGTGLRCPGDIAGDGADMGQDAQGTVQDERGEMHDAERELVVGTVPEGTRIPQVHPAGNVPGVRNGP